MAKQRDPVIDSMRGIGIVLMVLGHSGFPGTDFIYLFHMALFFMLSGWLFSLRGGPVHFIKRKAVALAALCAGKHRLYRAEQPVFKAEYFDE